MLQSKLKEIYQDFEKDGLLFTCKYKFTSVKQVKNHIGEIIDHDIQGFSLLMTAGEVYNEWLEQKGKPQEPQKTVEEQLEEERKRVVCLEAAMAELAKQVAENTLLK